MIASRIDTRTLDFRAPRSAEANELNRLLRRQIELVAKVDELEHRLRSSHQDAAEASSALERLERRSFAGEKVTDAQRKRAEDALAKAQRTEREPWSERARAAQQAVRDAEQVVRAFVAEHLDALLAELAEDAEHAAEAVNTTGAAFMAATAERRRVEQATGQLVSLVRPVQPNMLPVTRSDAAAVEVSRFLSEGGEVAPIPRAIEPVSV